jgi:hypothetical protein
MGVLVTLLGAGLIAAALVDIFQTLFHPADRGAMRDWTARAVWNLFRTMARSLRKVLTYAGPTAILAIMVSWAVLVCLGFALVYLPHLASGFSQVANDRRMAKGRALEAVTLSVGAVITVSEVIYARLHWLELRRRAEAIVGFGLLTAGVPWLLSIYPVLEARGSLAQRTTLLHHAERVNRLDVVRDSPAETRARIFKIWARTWPFCGTKRHNPPLRTTSILANPRRRSRAPCTISWSLLIARQKPGIRACR